MGADLSLGGLTRSVTGRGGQPDYNAHDAAGERGVTRRWLRGQALGGGRSLCVGVGLGQTGLQPPQEVFTGCFWGCETRLNDKPGWEKICLCFRPV